MFTVCAKVRKQSKIWQALEMYLWRITCSDDSYSCCETAVQICFTVYFFRLFCYHMKNGPNGYLHFRNQDCECNITDNSHNVWNVDIQTNDKGTLMQYRYINKIKIKIYLFTKIEQSYFRFLSRISRRSNDPEKMIIQCNVDGKRRKGRWQYRWGQNQVLFLFGLSYMNPHR